MPPRIAVVGSGGAALGEVTVPGLVDLEKRGIDTFVGTSVSAVLAALGGGRRACELPDIWDEVADVGRPWFMRPNADLWNGAFTLNPTRNQIEARRAGRKLKLDTRVGLVDIATRAHRVVRLNELGYRDRLDAIIGSSTQPAIHERTKLQGRYVVDGGVKHVASPLPKWWTYDEVHYFFCSPVGPERTVLELPQREVNSALEQAVAALDCFLDVVARRDYARVRRQAAQAKEQGLNVRFKVYSPESWTVIGESFDASPELSKARRAEGARMYGDPIFDSHA